MCLGVVAALKILVSESGKDQHEILGELAPVYFVRHQSVTDIWPKCIEEQGSRKISLPLPVRQRLSSRVTNQVPVFVLPVRGAKFVLIGLARQ